MQKVGTSQNTLKGDSKMNVGASTPWNTLQTFQEVR